MARYRKSLKEPTEFGALIEEDLFIKRAPVARGVINLKFAQARSGKNRRATRNFVIGLDSKLSSIAGYLYEHTHESFMRAIFSVQDLPQEVHGRLSKAERKELALRIAQEIIMRQLVIMRNAAELSYNDRGEWRLRNTLDAATVVEQARESYRGQHAFHRLARTLQSPPPKRRVKTDRRNFHGHPRAHDNRGPLGVCVSTTS